MTRYRLFTRSPMGARLSGSTDGTAGTRVGTGFASLLMEHVADGFHDRIDLEGILRLPLRCLHDAVHSLAKLGAPPRSPSPDGLGGKVGAIVRPSSERRQVLPESMLLFRRNVTPLTVQRKCHPPAVWPRVKTGTRRWAASRPR